MELKMRKAEIVILTVAILTVFVTAMLIVVEQKAQHRILDGHCTTQKVLTFVPLNKNCIPAIQRRDCNNTNEPVNVDCSRWFKSKELR